MEKLTLGVIGTSKKTDEQRIPIHPDHLAQIPEEIRKQLIFEKGYGKRFNISDEEIAEQTGGVATRSELLQDVGSVLLTKPVLSDLQELAKNGIMWGYPHCVQQKEITQTAIERKLTLIAFEDMSAWMPDGKMGLHTFYKNNELAGYCAVLHACQLRGINGHYGKQRKVLIFSFGAVSRGAAYALKAHGFRDITICIQRPDHEFREEILDVNYLRLRTGQENGPRIVVEDSDGSRRPLTEIISEADIIVNGTFQDPNNPFDFVTEAEKDCLKTGCLIIDVSCDEGMGFYFAKPTTFKDPMFSVGKVDYYAVDHTPSYLWESASRCISSALMLYLPDVVRGREHWAANKTLDFAINIDRGVIVKDAILDFQNRNADYPHLVK